MSPSLQYASPLSKSLVISINSKSLSLTFILNQRAPLCILLVNTPPKPPTSLSVSV